MLLPAGVPPIQAQVAPGTYYTAVNIHNPSQCKPVTFKWKVAQGLPLKVGPIKWFPREFTLGPDEVIEIDSGNILSQLAQPPSFFKGYVVIESSEELDVVAVYSGNASTNATTTAPLSTFHTERVDGRVISVGDHLVLPLNTGIADWRYIGTKPGPYFKEQPVALIPPVTQNPWTEQRVSELVSDNNNPDPASVNVAKRYRLCFDLCCGFEAADTQLRITVDDEATLWLNGSQFATITTPNSPQPITMKGNLLRVGSNCIEIEVVNKFISATSFGLMGLLQVPRGRCCCKPLPLRRPEAR